MSRDPFGWDLPPGCKDSDIPGNRPIDVFIESWEEEHYEEMLDTFIADNEGLVREIVQDSKEFDRFLSYKANVAFYNQGDDCYGD